VISAPWGELRHGVAELGEACTWIIEIDLGVPTVSAGHV
jgi:hypothetical protein